MGVTKESLSAAISPAISGLGGTLVWTSVCEAYLATKVQLKAGAGDADFDRAAMAARQAAIAHAAREGVTVESFIAEFVDDTGKVVSTRRFGGGAAKKPGPGEQPAQRSPSGDAGGHAPIGGLAGTNAGIPGVGKIIAVGAGKGGVGKSTVALNIAVGLSRRGHSVGLLDGDIYGPSMPTMLGLESLEAVVQRGMLQPFYEHGVKCMTIGKLVDPDKPLIWRGPMAHGAFRQLAEQTEWGELDYLIIDLPPGTGDVSLTMAQLLKLSGAVVVCTPQKVAQDDAVRAAKMFQQLGIEVLGVVENMSYFVGDDGKAYDIFGRGGAEVMAQRLNLPFLGSIPITMSLRVNSDKGNPTANFEGKDAAGKSLKESLEKLVTNLEGQVSLASLKSGKTTLKVS